MQTTVHTSRIIAITALLIALLVGFALAMTTPVRADNDDHGNKHDAMENEDHDRDLKNNQFSKNLLGERATNTPATVLINAAGKVKLTAGEVTESNWPNLKVKTWGVIWSVHVMPDAKIIGGTNTGTTTPPVTVSIGDKVDILGDIEVGGLMHARSFRDRSTVVKQADDLQTRIKALLEQIENLRSQLKDIRKNTGGALGNAFGH